MSLLQLIQVSGLVHEEHAVDLQRFLGKHVGDFLDAADRDLGLGVGIAHGGDDFFCRRTPVETFFATVVEPLFEPALVSEFLPAVAAETATVAVIVEL